MKMKNNNKVPRVLFLITMVSLVILFALLCVLLFSRIQQRISGNQTVGTFFSLQEEDNTQEDYAEHDTNASGMSEETIESDSNVSAADSARQELAEKITENEKLSETVGGDKSAAERDSKEGSDEDSLSEHGHTSKAQDDSSSEVKENFTGSSAHQQEIEQILSEMSLHEKISQMFIVTPEKLTGYEKVVQAGEVTKQALAKNPVGGIIYSVPNLISKAQTKEMITASQQYAEDAVGIPLFISVDEEGGNVARCAKALGTTAFSPMYQYRKKGTKAAYQNAKTIAEDISELGFNLDFAPVADTWSNPENTVIGSRAYSDDFAECALLVASAIEGFHDGGVLCTLKHFPGHGNTAEDSHTGSAYSDKSLEELRKEEFLPFKKGISSGADFVMIGHVTLKKIDSVPATLSYKITTQLLREELGFKGIIITDALGMDAVSQQYDTASLVVKAVQAGNDMLLDPGNLDEAITAIEASVEAGEITEGRIDESVRRILKVKYEEVGI